MKVLLVDDDPDVLESLALSFQLQWHGTEVYTATDGDAALRAFYEVNPHVVLLDIMLPRISGYEVLRKIRQVSDVPVIMLTAKDEEIDKVKGLELGADDYITKPFGYLELFARIRAVLRRTGAVPKGESLPRLDMGDLTIDFSAKEVYLRGKLVPLTPTEYRLLYILVRNAGHIVPAETLLTRVWGEAFRDRNDYLKVYINRLRTKLEDDPDRPRYIATERGVGYRFLKTHSF
jgi:two-component system KDP operon response regulator KdpE